MPLEPFFHHFPELGKQETRSLTIGGVQHGVPAGRYAFIELYCTESGCDCRRVMLQVLSESDGVVASISYSFDRNGAFPGPLLDPLHKRSLYSEGLLKLTEDLLFSDPVYVARLERHYHMIKNKRDRPAAKNQWWKRKPKKRKRPPQ